jgi:hypothetical protein
MQFLLFLFLASAQAGGARYVSPTPTVAPASSAAPVSSPVAIAGGPVTISVNFTGVFTEAQKSKINAAVKEWAQNWSTVDFKNKVRNFSYYGTVNSFSQTSDSNEVVYGKIMGAISKHVTYAINSVANGSETAATNTSTGLTTLQVLYLDHASMPELENTLSHEYTHTPEGGSYTHSYLCTRWMPWTLVRPYSVPYGVGSITEEMSSAKNKGKL